MTSWFRRRGCLAPASTCLNAGRQPQGTGFVANDSPAGLLEFEDTGLDFLDYQQDYVVGGSVKVFLVAPDPEVLVLLRAGDPARPRVASLEEIFRLRCIVCANRSKTRDWLDMYVMLQRGLLARAIRWKRKSHAYRRWPGPTQSPTVKGRQRRLLPSIKRKAGAAISICDSPVSHRAMQRHIHHE